MEDLHTEEIVVAVGSDNPVKLGATMMGLRAVWPDSIYRVIRVEPAKFPSVVSHQPMSLQEIVIGAEYRAKEALFGCPSAKCGVGLESGAYKIGEEWFETGCVVIVDGEHKRGIGFSVSMKISEKVFKFMELHKDLTLGQSIDILFTTRECAKNQGYFGLATRNRITRQSACRDAVIAALCPWIHPELF